jgi:hypothetical protein
MGVMTRVLWKAEDGSADVRLHWWSEQFRDPRITRETGAVHLHSFNMFSRVLHGRVRNTLIDFDNVFGPTSSPIASGDTVWTMWQYENGVPTMRGQGFCETLAETEYVAGDTFRMPAGVYHFYEPIDGDALTMVYRRHVKHPNMVLTQGNVPHNGRRK